ncbi:nitroreductase family protein [Haloferax mediterranei ATCC 33500]|uniref:NAD(P)H nitroreductase n=1 Tax=Haloferax mediterranei (strain ATCC 33500 / DSM 1411 / JCM 8866 / NBRC 14739 / NCIMB 2177 / R-4) TaxID=523841 RepID=I3R748_HALMT|nr:nitroreductase family protein [Haloferax mediterranei]AFK20058.1 putative NAD(P)H nitroreductase [Haloferax mediterranei ATCC 33500]AHZ23435.1 NAD(P)H nitroreductase [Haloferax mediterranei ATCC 33500]ELZ99606.1 putative NAD(P)H nitroreductase [Haloferax mediterranei ATCC 33500]MDX5987190.1 nitroreductase family protein [Haloferax mediterranei ATCC 33500]QCQ76496.1 nitroreductase family protein [Haloferax mediterranei ATCC 33500]
MDFEEVVATRRSIHEYADEPLDDETLETIFENAIQAPSSYNLQPWEFVVLREDETKQALREAAYDQEHVTGAAASVIILGNKDPEAHAQTVADDMLEKGYLPNEDARDGVLESIAGMADLPEQERRVWTVRSTSLVAMSLMNAAWDEGVGTCPIGGFDPDAVLEAFDIDGEQYEPVMLLTMGIPAEDAGELQAEKKYRRPVDEVVHYEAFAPEQTADPAPADD